MELLDLDKELAMVAEMAERKGLEPTSFVDATNCCPDQLDWRKAMEEEYETLQKMGTWKPIEPLPGTNIVGSKWTYPRRILWAPLFARKPGL